ncbi:hydroxyproline-rich glycoprotein family protein [Striga hermonthica]|uniref:Hydroxyproline-rich glycoprotein family protein n=1 Tax=Striga hermonthica TaxID=68872 RepID=A0A9N7N0K5_STRHE|nr:hydroxyproline-rich glycoprotein family protein [Striga hermonthica]
MEDGDGGDLTPFWVQSTTNARRGDRLRRRASAMFLSSGLVVFLLLVTAVFFLVFILPSTISLSSQIFRPNSVKKSWDSLNIVLVLVAVVFGFLSRNKNEERFNNYVEFQYSPSKQQDGIKSNYGTLERRKSNLSNSSNWYEYSDYEAKLERKNSILTRNSSSYPDLRDFPATDYWSYGDYYRRRYFDDIHVDTGRIWISDPDPEPGRSSFHRRHRSLEAVEHLRAPAQSKTVFVDTLLTKSKRGEINKPSLAAAAAEVAAPCPEENPKTRDVSGARLKEEDSEPSDPIKAQRSPAVPDESVERTYQRGARRKEKSGRKRKKDAEVNYHIAATPPSAPPPPPLKSSNSDRKGNPTKDFLNSLYQKRKKKQRQKSADHLDPLLHEAQTPSIFQIPPPTPPPPPPPPTQSVFQNLFSSKKHKRKRIIKVTLEPQLEPTSYPAPPTTDEPPSKPPETSNSSGESPLNNLIPPPPPPPPPGFFKTPAWKFVVHGDYVRIDSIESSRSGSPDTDDGGSPNFCQSPDVNTKAESFITNFRAKLKMEKIHSMKKREVGLSGLGPGTGATQFSQRI